MGLISKLEDKLAGHSSNKEENKLEKKAIQHETGTSGSQSGEPDPLRNPIQGQSQGATTGAGSAVRSDARNVREAYGGQSGGNSGSNQPTDRVGGAEFRDYDGYGSRGQQQGGIGNDDTRGPRQAMDPYTSKGQNAAASAGQSGQPEYNSTIRREGDTIPSAGGQKLGSGNGSDPYNTSDAVPGRQQHQHHYGRDAALAGGAGAAGAGAYEYEKGRHGNSGPASKTTGPHDSNVANVMDPRVKPQPENYRDQGPYQSGMANQLSSRGGQGQDQHHYGRDAAGVGAAGVGAYELDKHHREHRGEEGTGRHHHGEPGMNDNRGYDNIDPSSRGQGRDHHYGRDAAGVGAAGVGAYELDKHHRQHRDEDGTGRHHRGEQALDNRAQQVMTDNRGPPGTAYTSDEPSGRHHHGGRDAALAGGAGAAGIGAYEMDKERHHGGHHHHHGRDQQGDVYDNQQQGPNNGRYNDVSYMNRPPPGTQLDGPQQGHPIRDAALAGTGGAGVGALAERHHDQGRNQNQQYQQGQEQAQRDSMIGGPGMGGSQQQQQGGNMSGSGLSGGGLPTEKKLGGAYEAGYRDAMAHVEAQMKNQQL